MNGGVKSGVKPAAVPSPCINVCRMDERSGWCVGCFRTLDEIAAWSRLGNAERSALWQQLPERQQLWQRLQPRAAGDAS